MDEGQSGRLFSTGVPRLLPDESLEDLQRAGLRLIQKQDGFRFSEDAVLLAHLAAARMRSLSPAPVHFVELGSHSGVVSILFQEVHGRARGLGIELVPRQAALMRRNIELNGLESRLAVLEADMRLMQSEEQLSEHGLKPGIYDCVLVNPPYFCREENAPPPDPSLQSDELRIARTEAAVNFAEICRLAALLLRPRGRLFLVHRPHRCPELFAELARQQLQPDLIQPLAPTPGAAPSLLFLSAVRDGRSGGFEFAPTLTLRDGEGRYTGLAAEIYGGEAGTVPAAAPQPDAAALNDWDARSEAGAAVEGGTLYLVGTPIGNLGDLSPRAGAVLAAVDRIACEDTRRTSVLLQRLGISRPLISYHAHNQRSREAGLLEALAAGESLALVSDAGMPAISDPGVELVRAALAAGYAVRVVPGPTAAVSALAASGFDTMRFCFEGFLPRRPAERSRRLQELVTEPRTLLFYEAPHRLERTLAAIEEAGLGARRILLARELTKRYEEILRLTVSEALEYCARVKPRGEYTLVLEGCAEAATRGLAPAAAGETPEDAPAAWRDWLLEARRAGQDSRSVRRTLVECYGLDRNAAYAAWLAAGEADGQSETEGTTPSDV
ncbi:MAG: 16S rRNA (cytidine(1402)-2'-O)-methyltransferase [Bacillota bacterium]|nr:16S rRNA (cytidine(1402)-2'-O)-methyltransferase [Bacillota bacterium]